MVACAFLRCLQFARSRTCQLPFPPLGEPAVPPAPPPRPSGPFPPCPPPAPPPPPPPSLSVSAPGFPVKPVLPGLGPLPAPGEAPPAPPSASAGITPASALARIIALTRLATLMSRARAEVARQIGVPSVATDASRRCIVRSRPRGYGHVALHRLVARDAMNAPCRAPSCPLFALCRPASALRRRGAGTTANGTIFGSLSAISARCSK